MLSLAEVLIKKELPFVTDWYSLDSVKTNNLWKDIRIIKIAYAIYLSRDCSVILALSWKNMIAMVLSYSEISMTFS